MGPLAGVRVIELKGLGPGPYAGMLLADMGAEVISVERSRKSGGISLPAAMDINCRGKRSIAINLKSPEGVEVLLDLIESSDMLIEGFRPGVMEKLGVGPDICHQRNPKLVYGRITGWGQTGPLSQVAGHDINYISLAGALAAIGGKDKPVPPLNLVGDYAAGSMFLIMGMLAALYRARETGEGDVVDAAITDGTANLMTIAHSFNNVNQWSPARESNLLDGAAHFYRCYETADAKFVSIGSIEPQFYALLIEKAELDASEFGDQMNMSSWAVKQETLENVFKQKTRDQWCEIMEGTDVCFAPVLDINEAPLHPHNKARETYITVDGKEQPAPAPRFTNSPTALPQAASSEGADTDSILSELGYSDGRISELMQNGALPS